MKYNQEDIIRLIDLAFSDYTVNEDFQRKVPLAAPSDMEHMQSLLKQPETLQALLIVFSELNLCDPGAAFHTSPLLVAADQYPLSYLALSNRTINALSHQPALVTVGDLLRMSDAELTRIRGIGPRSKAMEEIRTARIKFIREFHDGLIR